MLAFAATVLAAAGCGGSTTVTGPAILPAAVYRLVHFEPSGPVAAGKTVRMSFAIKQPSGATLTSYKHCCEPHAGVDLIIVRSDDSNVQYDDSDIAPDGQITQPVVFPAPGRYRIVIDTYPRQTSPQSPRNFQLFTWVTVKGRYRPQPLPPFQATHLVHGYRFQIEGHPQLHAIQASFLTINVRTPDGNKAVFGSWRGALAHALFIHQGSLDYFHTHVCGSGAVYCASLLGSAKVTGSSRARGQLKVGVLLPEAGTWRMFLLTYIDGHQLTVPFTLRVR